MERLFPQRSLFKYQSGRVIALGRVMLVTLFLFAVWLDQSQNSEDEATAYVLLIAYALFAIVIAAATWRNWWLDARLAVVTHAVDMAVFTAIVFSINGSASPFFLFFVLPLLSAAIRWGWRETALTATALVVLYMSAGLLLAGSKTFELERFVVRSGHLMILSLLLIWFGIHQRITRLFVRVEEFDHGLGELENPLDRALGLAMRAVEAQGGVLIVGPAGEDPCDGFSMIAGEIRGFSAERPLVRDPAFSAVLFDVRRNRALTRPPEGQFRFIAAAHVLDLDEARRLGLTIGLIAEVRTGTQQGWLALWGIPDLSADFIDIGRELGRAAGAVLDHYALLEAIKISAAARTRLSLARDVHDSVVQFLAGAAFRVEAIKRAARPGAKIGAELDELKRLLIEEQGEIRGVVLALRRDHELQLAEAVDELRALAHRLGRQWSVDCSVTADDDQAAIPIRLQLDLQQMLREAVANAVRHGGADRIEIGLAVRDNRLQFSVEDNGSGFPAADREAASEPRSLKERVERARGTLRLVSARGSTNILISLPLAGAIA